MGVFSLGTGKMQRFDLSKDVVGSNGNLIFRRGESIKISWEDRDLPEFCELTNGVRSYTITTKRLPQLFSDIYNPENDDLESWVYGSEDTLSVFGDPIEPDGWDSGGSPSWLLALGLI